MMDEHLSVTVDEIERVLRAHTLEAWAVVGGRRSAVARCSCGHESQLGRHARHQAEYLRDYLTPAEPDAGDVRKTPLPKGYALRCASCGDRATTTILLEGFTTPVCLRHYNVWNTPTFREPDAGDDVHKTPLPKDGPITRGGECSEHGAYSIGPDCPKCVREVLEWTS